MKATFYGNSFINQSGNDKEAHNINLPFAMVTARAIIIRQDDGAILAMVHHEGAKYALPGGLIDDGENAHEAVTRELEEENVQLSGIAAGWEENIYVDYFAGYKALSLWFVIPVEDATFGPNPETLETRWVQQSEEVWHPGMRAKIMMAVREYVPGMVR